MPFSSNTGFGPPPIATNIAGQGPEEFGIPYPMRAKQGGPPSGGLNVAWAAWFISLFTRIAYRIIQRAGVDVAEAQTPPMYRCTQANLSVVSANLTASDIGLLVEVTDYAHVLRWTGSAWVAGPGTWDAGVIAFFDVDPGTGWKLIDGNGDGGTPIGGGDPIKILQRDGTTRNNTTAAAMNAGVFIRGAAAYNGAVTAAVAPTLAGATASGAAVIGNDSGGGTVVFAGVGTTVATHTHNHTDSGHTHNIGTLVTSLAGGPPVGFTDALPYIRK